eukprot:TRINITY_DN93356_c0_g1_i1.p1 TRINITY_DN93356_c0_g1~~TRINITY_DN93356_c0_g1_i1.p1  ORF type:complete len:321 (-),score=63.68 TRINITY_DN93356_c0_g1_i1:299-1261(-)
MAKSLPVFGTAFALLFSYGQCNPVGFKVKIERTLEHVDAPWTQGLELMDDGNLLETTGSYPQGTISHLRILNPQDGSVISKNENGLGGRFVEGIAKTSYGWIATTYGDHKAVKYNPNLAVMEEMDYDQEGWGLAPRPGGGFFTTNGSVHITQRDANLQEVSVKNAECMGYAIPGLNELEFVPNFMGLGETLLANVYQSRFVMGVDPVTSKCNSLFDLNLLGDVRDNEYLGFHVANGISQLKDSSNLMLTGKNWKNMFEVSLEQDASDPVIERFQNWAKKRAVMLSTSYALQRDDSFSWVQTKEAPLKNLRSQVEAKPHQQ